MTSSNQRLRDADHHAEFFVDTGAVLVHDASGGSIQGPGGRGLDDRDPCGEDEALGLKAADFEPEGFG